MSWPDQSCRQGDGVFFSYVEPSRMRFNVLVKPTTIYEYKLGMLTAKEAAPYQSGMIRPVNHHLIPHLVNSGTRPFLSLHVYGSPHATGEITGNARVFDLWEGSIQYTDGGVCFDLPEDLINPAAPSADVSTAESGVGAIS